MTALKKIQFAMTVTAFLWIGAAIAQDESDDEADVMFAVEAQWDANENGDKKWIDNMLMGGFYGWAKGTPAPRSVSSTRMWDRFNSEQGKMVAHELYMLGVVIEGDTAIVHYLYSSAYQPKDGEIEMRNGRYTDVLVRTDSGWKFLAWHGGADD